MSTFSAKYGGYCHAECGSRIEPGDLVTYADDELVHADCSEHEVPERPQVVCTTCWLVQPCDCEEAA